MIKKFKKFIVEKVQPDWFDKNPDFYLSRNVKDMDKNKEYYRKSKEKTDILVSKLKKTSVNEIKFKHDKYTENSAKYDIISPQFLKGNSINVFNKEYTYSAYQQSEYHYKIYLAFINHKNKNWFSKNSITFKHVDKNIINPLFKELNNFYGVYYKCSYDDTLYLTRDKEEYKEKINYIKEKGYKIIYYNHKVKGKEFTDFDIIEISKIKNKLKNITIDDLYYERNPHKSPLGDRDYYNVRFKDKELDEKVRKYKLVSEDFFFKEEDSGKVYFGHLKNRYHTRSISHYVKGIGLGYKIYKGFLRFNGYMVSDSQTSVDARKMYYNLLKDNDIYHVIDKNTKDKSDFGRDSNKIMLMWKTFPKIKQLLRIVRTHELRNGRKYEYDKQLLKDLKHIKG